MGSDVGRIHPARVKHTVRGVGALLAMLVLVFGFASPAGAHAQLEWTQPIQSSVSPSPPRQVIVHFGEAVEIDFGSLRVIGPNGNRVDQGGTHHPPGDSHSVAIDLPAHLPNGTYVVAWRVISTDSHPVHGAFVFSVGSASEAARANALANSLATESGSSLVVTIFWLIRLAAFVSLALLVGVAFVVILAWRKGGSTRRIGRLLWTAWWVLLFCTVAGVAVQGVYAAALPLTDITHPVLFDEVLHTRFGAVELLRAALLMLFIPVLLVIQGSLQQLAMRSWLWITIAAVVGIGLLSTPGLAGHATSENGAIFGLTLDVMHVGAASMWIGGLVVIASILMRGLPEDQLPPDARCIVMNISTLAFGAVLVIVFTGVIQTIRQVGSLYALTHTPYGRILMVKVALVIVMIAAGALSRRIVLGDQAVPLPRWYSYARIRRRAAAMSSSEPGATLAIGTSVDGTGPVRLLERPIKGKEQPDRSGRWALPESGGKMRSLRRSVLAEIAIAFAVLAVTALLVNAAPAKQAASQPFSETFSTLGIQVNAIVDPARTGPGNQFHFYLIGRLGQPVAIPEFDASISLPSQNIGPLSIPLLSLGQGHYVATHVDIPIAGTWVLKLLVRTTAIDEQVVVASLPVH